MARWAVAGYDTSVERGAPTSALFVDGGIMSNFPIETFHDYWSRCRYADIRRRFWNTTTAAMRSAVCWICSVPSSPGAPLPDYDFLYRNPEYRQLVRGFSKAGKYNWLDFDERRDQGWAVPRGVPSGLLRSRRV